MKEIKESLDPLNMLTPFEWNVWLILIGSLSIAPFLNTKKLRRMKSLFDAWSVLLRQGVSDFTSILCIWSLCGTIIR